MKLVTHHKVFVLVAFLINLAVWAIPSDVVELVARDRQTLLGRYSREHFAWIIGLIPVSLIACWLHLSPNNQVKKRKAFRLITVLLVVVPSVLAIDVVMRLTAEYDYLLDDLAYRRVLEKKISGTFEDKPEAVRTYPHVPQGFGTVDWTLTTDKRGFRNSTNLDQYDVVVLGDSFAEGSRVSDADAFAARLGSLLGEPVLNLGMSGYAPQHYLASLKKFGLAVKPKQVVCLIYEGNDFDSAELTTEKPAEWSRYFKRSPIVQMIDAALIRTLAPIGARREVAGLDVLSWQPIACPAGAGARYYAFPPTFLKRHFVDREEFASGKKWRRTVANLEQMHEACRQAGAELIVVLAPTKPHVVMPLVAETLPAEKVLAFAAMGFDGDLPDAKTFLDELLARLDVKENVLAEWCGKKKVSFLSLTPVLTAAMADGRQVYYTYDEHWTPVGHEVVAQAVFEFLGKGGAVVEPVASAGGS